MRHSSTEFWVTIEAESSCQPVMDMSGKEYIFASLATEIF